MVHGFLLFLSIFSTIFVNEKEAGLSGGSPIYKRLRDIALLWHFLTLKHSDQSEYTLDPIRLGKRASTRSFGIPKVKT
jgi:hypothetical protein